MKTLSYIGKGSNPNSRANLTYKIKKGSVPWNKGKGRHDVECPQCGKVNSQLKSQGTRFCNKKCVDRYQEKPNSYGAVHNWVRRHFGTPDKCEHCNTTDSKKFEWANISGEYQLKREDWARLCCKCHRRYDFGTKNRIEVLDV